MIINLDFIQQLKKENILILGFGKTGLELTNFLFDKNINQIFIYDEKEKENLSHHLSLLRKNPKKLFLGDLTENPLKDIHRIITSPSIPIDHILLKEARQKKILIQPEIEFSFSLIQNIKKIIGITGSNGKTTTTYLLNNILNQVPNLSHFVAGNTDDPMISIIDKLKTDSILLLELSSFMLESSKNLNINIASILNIFPHHLDRHKNFLDYLKAKKNIFKYQNENDYALINYDNPYYSLLKGVITSKIFSFSIIRKNNIDLFIKNSFFYLKNEKLFPINTLKLTGSHNLSNALVSIGIAKILGIENHFIEKGVRNFNGLPHRLESLKKINNTEFINNSKATNPISVLFSLESLPGNNIILIMGGINETTNFQFLNPCIQKKVKKLIIYGESKNSINQQIDFPDKSIVQDLKEAFLLSIKSITQNTDYILFSPGCLSFDQFLNYHERGEYFRRLVEDYFLSIQSIQKK